MKRAFWTAALLAAAGAALAAPVTERDARQALFDPDNVEIVVFNLPFLSEKDRSVLGQVAQSQKYYGAIAFGPDDGLLSESLVGAFNFHDVATARAAALAGCEGKRKGKAACQVVAMVRPKGWEEGRAISLSGEATSAFETDYRKARGPKALAISPSTGRFAVAADPTAPGTALAKCRAAAQTSDCVVVLSE